MEVCIMQTSSIGAITSKNMVPFPCKARSTKVSYKLRAISCNVREATMKGETTLYQVLSLPSQNVGFDEIKKAYRSMALRYHPDVCPDDPTAREESTRRFVELQKAYDTLSDPVARKTYDCQLGFRGFYRDGEFSSRQVWENQLYGLQMRSRDRSDRMEKKKNGSS